MTSQTAGVAGYDCISTVMAGFPGTLNCAFRSVILFPALTEGVADRCDEFFVFERLHKKGDRADGHCGRADGQILSRGNDNYTSLG
jgi:hypothetical protein